MTPRTITFTGGFEKLGTVEPRYRVEIEITDGEKTTSRWISADRDTTFLWSKMRRLIWETTEVPPTLAVPENSKLSQQAVWEQLLEQIGRTCVYIDAPDEASLEGMVRTESFKHVLSFALCETIEDFRKGRYRYETPSGKTCFLPDDLLKHLRAAIDAKIPPSQLWSILYGLGVRSESQRIFGSVMRVRTIPTDVLTEWQAEQGCLDDDTVTPVTPDVTPKMENFDLM